MDIGTIIILAIVIFVILAVGGGIGFWIWIASRPKKMTWDALIYQVGEGVIQKAKYKGKNIVNYKLSDLVPYTKDVIEKIEKKSGATYYWLQKLKKPVPVVTADCVEVWTQKEKVVRVLLEEDTCTLLKSGYDRITGSMLFRPMPHDRLNMIKTELSERKARIENTKDVLAAITPFVVVGIAMLGLVSIAYFIGQAGVQIAESLEEVSKSSSSTSIEIAKIYARYNISIAPPTDERKIIKEEPPEIPP
jgi:hypothetical protein